MERRIGDAHHRQQVIVHLYGLADDVGIGVEIAAPEPVADHDHRVASRRVLVRRQERAAQRRAHAQHLEVVAGDDLAKDRPRPASPAEIGREDARPEEPCEGARLIAQVAIIEVRHRQIASGVGFRIDDAEPRRALDARERAERHALQHREDDRIHADAQRQDADDGQ